MIENVQNFKERFIELFMLRDVWKQKVSDSQYRTRCVYCGDSKKDFNTGHLYIKCNKDDRSPIVYNCFKCTASGLADADFFKLLDLDELISDNFFDKLKNNFSKVNNSHRVQDFIYENYSCFNSNKYLYKLDYIEKRIGVKFNNEMVNKCKVITSIKEFLKYNKIKDITVDKYILDILDRDYIGFLSYGNTHIFLRDITNTHKLSWVKYKIYNSNSLVVYNISNSINVLTTEDITINISEGILDILSIAYNLNNIGDNIINFANGSKSYFNLINHIIKLGLVGNNVTLNIYSDNDKKFNNDSNYYDTTINYYKKVFRYYKLLFKEINVYYNILRKDCGECIENISLSKHKI